MSLKEAESSMLIKSESKGTKSKWYSPILTSGGCEEGGRREEARGSVRKVARVQRVEGGRGGVEEGGQRWTEGR
jgi:hypothetical protein